MYRISVTLALLFASATPPIASAADAPSPSNVAAAKVNVPNSQPLPFGTGKAWTESPPFLNGATIFEPNDDAGHVLQFDVIEGGIVLMAASWTADGDNTGDWRKGRATTPSLLREGWNAVSSGMLTTTNNAPDSHFLFRRIVTAGESYKIHTRQKQPPLLILPAADRVAEIAALPPIAELQPGGSPLWKLAVLNARSSDASTRDFADEPKAGSVLVGLQVTSDFSTTRQGICSIQPIYESSDGRIRGPEFGPPGATSIELEARPGYAVGAIIGSSSRNIAGLQLVFMRRTKTGVDTDDAYQSRWAGLRNSESEVKIGGDGRAIGGLRGKVGQALQSLESLPAIP